MKKEHHVAFEGSEIWFLTGSQGLYGEETLQQVAEQSQRVAATLDGAADRPGVLEDGLPDDADGHLAGLIEGGGDPLRLRRHLLEGLLAVQVLAAGQEPDLLTFECHWGVLTHRWP